MSTPLKEMSGYEFVQKGLAGERDFRGIHLSGFNFHVDEGGRELQEYFKGQDFKKDPIDVSGSNLEGLCAFKIDLPYLRARGTLLYEAHLEVPNLEGADFSGANLRNTHLSYANLEGAMMREAILARARLYRSNLHRANLYQTNLQTADFRWASLDSADMRYANAWGTNFEEATLDRADISHARVAYANLKGASIKGVKGLDNADEIEYAIFNNTRVGPDERKFVERMRTLYSPHLVLFSPESLSPSPEDTVQDVQDREDYLARRQLMEEIEKRREVISRFDLFVVDE